MALASGLALLSNGCLNLGGRRSQRVEIGSLEVTNFSGQPVLVEVLQTETMRFADNYATTVAQAVDDYVGTDPSSDARIQAVKWKLSQATAAFIDAAGPNPVLNALDLVVLATVSRMVMEDEVPRIFGEQGENLVATQRKLETNAWLAVKGALKPEQQQELRNLIEEWRRRNPDIRYVGAIRLRQLAESVGRVPRAASSGPNSIFRLVSLDPLAGLDPTAEAIAQTREWAERAMYYSQRMPTLLDWQIQLLSLQLAAQPEIKQVLADSDRLTRSTAAFAQLADQMPKVINEQSQAGPICWLISPRNNKTSASCSLRPVKPSMPAVRWRTPSVTVSTRWMNSCGMCRPRRPIRPPSPPTVVLSTCSITEPPPARSV